MNTHRNLLSASAAILIVLALCPIAFAAVNTTGDVTPDPTTTTTSDDLYVGDTADGSMTINFNSNVFNLQGYLGYYSNATGTATVTGAGSTWDNDGELWVGYHGNGIVNIENGGALSSDGGYFGHDSGSTGTVTITGADSSWHNWDDMFVGSGGNGVLNIENGGLVANCDGYISNAASSTSTATIDGAGSRWTNDDNLYIGNYGSGTLNIQNGGEVNTDRNTFVDMYSDGSGSISFNNGTLNTGGLVAGATELQGIGVINTAGLVSDIDLVFDQNNGLQQQIILNSELGQNITINLDQAFVGEAKGSMGAGCRGQGSLTIADGLAIRSNEGSYLGYHNGSTGTATVTGTGSSWTDTGPLRVGYFGGSGILNIQNGGFVANTYGYLGDEAGSTGTATVTGAGSSWNNSGELWVGRYGNGTLTIENGGAVANAYGWLGLYSGATGTVTVTGIGSTWTNSNNLRIGTSGTGVLNIENGGLVSTPAGSSIGLNLGSTGTATVTGTGSRWTNSSLYVGGSSTASGGTGTLIVSDGGVVDVTGELNIWSTGTLEIGLGGTTNDRYGKLVITGNASLGGTLDISLIDSFMPTLGDSFEIMTFASNTGEFDTINGLDLGDGLALRADWKLDSLTLLTLQPGDVDGSGFVNTDDINAFVTAMLQPGSFASAYPEGVFDNADINLDAHVNTDDINSFVTLIFGGDSGNTTIPEPTTLALLIVAGLALTTRRRTT